MKRKITLPIVRMILKPLCMLLLLSIVISAFMIFFPIYPAQLTLINNDKEHSQAICPALAKPLLNAKNSALTLPFTLLDWNIYKQQKQDWRTALQKFSSNADIITLQEAKLSPELIAFSKDNNWLYLQNYAFKHNGFLYGVNTLSKIEAISACGTADQEPWIRIPKTAIATLYPIQNRASTLLVINLHAINFTLSEKSLHQQLSPYLTLIKKHDGPTIFSGDFNTWSKARLATVEQALNQLDFSEVFFEPDKRLTIFGLALDHIYFRGLKVIKTESIATKASDHNPLLVTFDIDN